MLILQWASQIGLGELLTAAGLLATALGLLFAARQLRQGAIEQRAQFLIDLTGRYFAEDDVRKFYYHLDYPWLEPKFTFDPKSFMGSNEERWLDQLLYTFDVIGQVVRMGALTKSEARIFAFQAFRVLDNEEVKKYLSWLNDEYRNQKRRTPAHADALYLVETLKSDATTYEA